MACCGSRRRETTPDDPVTLGEPDGADPIEARVNQRSFGMRTYDVGWFTGTGVAAAVAAAVITPV